MDSRQFLQGLQTATTAAEVENALDAFEAAHSGVVRWAPFGGRDNNRGVIEVSTDPGRALIERITNGIDANLEAEHGLHRGMPQCRSPKEAATAWLNVPAEGLSQMTPQQRRALAQRVTITLLPGAGRDARTVEVRDRGIGLEPAEMAGTILSLNESNKVTKHYLAGIYGQGGSSTLTVSKYTLIATRKAGQPVGFTVVKFMDLPPEEYRTGRYVYLTLNGRVLDEALPDAAFPVGTLVKIFGYDLTSYGSPLGPNSVYGLLNEVLFDPVLPVWFDNRLHGYRRVIKGSRNALNGAVDEGDDDRRGPVLAHNVPMFHVALGEFGRLGIEYWVLERPTQGNKRPTAAFVNPSRPIMLTLQGQTQAELSSVLVRKDAELPHLRERLICHVDCYDLSPAAKRALFVSNREDARRGLIYEMIQEEIVRVLRSDDELARLNREAHEEGMRERDESALQQMRTEVARLLRLQGLNIVEGVGGAVTAGGDGRERPVRPPRRPSRPPEQIELHEPPTYIRLLWDETDPITFYAQQRRYVRVETDANSSYHNANNPAASRINFIVSGPSVVSRGSSPLQGGRLRAIFDGAADAAIGQRGTIRVELARPGLPTLHDERAFEIVAMPPARPAKRSVTLPPFECVAVDGPDDPRWATLGWPDNVATVASAAEMEIGTLTIYYSTVFPKYAQQLATFERRDPALARSFTERYKIWLAVHSLLLYQDQTQGTAGEERPRIEEDAEVAEARERQERCRTATLAAVFAAREVQLGPVPVEAE
jgi:hypothetical protein